MFIILLGPPQSGKRQLIDYLLEKHNFVHVRISNNHASTDQVKECPTTSEMLEFTTSHWLNNYVTADVVREDTLEEFTKRPFVLVIALDAPILGETRKYSPSTTLEQFVEADDRIVYSPPISLSRSPLKALLNHTQLSIQNPYASLDPFYASIASLSPSILDQTRLRPSWDNYFMMLAELASKRSNCMKRRVGAVLVRDNRVISTGYNGTPRGLNNCNEGGCPRCNSSAKSGTALDECLCLHAEENALLEAGRERCGLGSVVYCNTCPCLRCSVKIAQVGVREVVYSKSYSMDDTSKMILEQAGVRIRQLDSR